MSRSQIAAANLASAVEHVIVPRAGRLPSNLWQLNAMAVSAFCTNQFISQRARIDFVAGLVSETLVEADVMIDGSKAIEVAF